MLGLHCSMQDLVPLSGIKSQCPALRAQNLSHWTTREAPGLAFGDTSPNPFYLVEGCLMFPCDLVQVMLSWLECYIAMQHPSQDVMFVTNCSLAPHSSVAQPCPTLCDPVDCSTTGLPAHHQLPEFTQTHVHWVGDAIQPSHPLSSPSPPAFSLSQHQALFQWVSSSHQVAKILEFQLQHQSFQWIVRTCFWWHLLGWTGWIS